MRLNSRLVQNIFGYDWLPEPKNREILALTISKERNICLLQRGSSLVWKIYGKQPVSTDGGGTWYPQACRFTGTRHHIHSPFEKSIIEKTIQYIKDRIESFDDYFPCRKEHCNLTHVKNWFNLFVNMHNKEGIKAQVNRAPHSICYPYILC